MSGAEDPEIRRLLESEMQRAQFQQAALELTEVCWNKCIDKIGSKPIGSGADGKTDACLVNCVERFLDTTTFLVERLTSRAGNQ